MKNINKFIFVYSVLCNVCVYSRNPFNFTDEELKKYTPIKVEKIQQEQQCPQKWKITETPESTQMIIEDNEGNVRTISLGSKN